MSRKRKTSSGQSLSTAVITVDIQSRSHDVSERIEEVRDKAESILDSKAPSKKIRKALLDTAKSLLQLQHSVVEKIPSLIPTDCSNYSLSRIKTANDFNMKTLVEVDAPRLNMRTRNTNVVGVNIPLPVNRKQYTAREACHILVEIDETKKNTKYLSLTKVVDAMLPYIPVGRSAMFRVLQKYRSNPDVEWSVRGKPPILSNSSFLDSIHVFEKDNGRSISKKDMKKLMKNAKENIAKEKENSTLIVESPSKRTINNYISLLPQLEANRSKTSKVQTGRGNFKN